MLRAHLPRRRLLPTRSSAVIASGCLLIAASQLAGSTSAPHSPTGLETQGAGITDAAPLDAPLTREQQAWVDATLASLDLRGKAAQLVMVRAFGLPSHPESAEHRALLAEIRELQVGGVVLFRSELDTIPVLLDELQQAAALPLLVASDFERSASFRITNGTVSLPDTMALGATTPLAEAERAAYFAGELTAREGRAAGIHWTFAPVADVNNNPNNPIINVRAFSEDPQRTARLVSAWIAGARSGGILTTAKHFPGHGDTATDSHLELPTIGGDRTRLDAIELAPFRAAIAAGVDAVMTGHLAVPALDPSGRPATLSRRITSDLLRGELGFRGLIVTDAMEMRGIGSPRPAPGPSTTTLAAAETTPSTWQGAWIGAATIQAVAAGADMVLLPPDARVAIQSLVRAVAEGELTAAQIDAAARRVLETKARLGLDQLRKTSSDAAASVDRKQLRLLVNRPADVTRASEIASQSITLVRNHGDIVPLRPETPLRILHLVLSSDWVNPQIGTSGGLVHNELADRATEVVTRRIGPELSPAAADAIVATATELLVASTANAPSDAAEPERRFTHVVVSAFVRVVSSRGHANMDPTHAALLERLAAASTRLVVVSYGNPYLLGQFPSVPVYLCTYSGEEVSQRAAVRALFLEQPVSGRLPVTLPDLYPIGHGLELPRRDLTLLPSTPEAAGFDPAGIAALDQLLAGYVARGAFPGGVIAVGHRGRLAHLAAFGRVSYAADAAAVTVDTIYDLASLTKVIATTTLAMIMVDEERLELDTPVAHYLPRFLGAGKETVTVRHLLTHSSGIDWWAPLYQEWPADVLPEARVATDQFLDRIYTLPLVATPGTTTKYSDLGILLLGEILERVSGLPLDQLANERVFGPLGMTHTSYRPPVSWRGQIAPTEWDVWRGRTVHGEVHDENAFALGGVAPHAGLFGTASDLARFAQMISWRGVYDHRRLVARETVETFTRAAELPAGSTRALGWDTKSAEGSSAGTLFSPSSFGHTGFTGTSLWIDPERELFVVLLTNRVHPTRDNVLIREVRPAVADAVVRALLSEAELGGAPASSTAPTNAAANPATSTWPVRVGLDRLDAGEVPELAGKRLGLLAHAASLTLDGRHALEVAQARGLQVVKLFSPEHGWRGQAAAGEKVSDGRERSSGLPLISLYGDHTKPTAADLAGLDALVIDLQDAGVRFYTYASTMLLCLEAAAEAGLPVYVLDRPNPLGGERSEGPFSASVDKVATSLVNKAPGPLQHGLTLGEMATLVNARRDRPAALTVITMRGWLRSMTWRATGRAWVPPSPNLRSHEAALAYPGVALLEATNLSEGRGTSTPFLVFGSPWLDADALLAALSADDPESLAGVRLTPTLFTPRASAAAPDPKFRDTECRGLRVAITNPDAVNPYSFGKALLRAVSRQPGFSWRRNGDALTWLLGTPELIDELAASVAEDTSGRASGADEAARVAVETAWREERRAALLYPRPR